jgi:hypothetical protein
VDADSGCHRGIAGPPLHSVLFFGTIPVDHLLTKGAKMRSTLVIIALTLVVACTGCKKDDSSTSTTPDQYTNKLTLGTGMNASNFTLTGEGTTFTRSSGSATIYYRFESAADFGGAGISIKIEKQSGSSYTLVGTYPYANPQNYGHIIMSAFVVADVGTFRATGLLTATSTTVASTAFTVN